MQHGKRGFGNCFVNGLWLYWKMGCVGKLVVKRRPGTKIPHLMIDCGEYSWHFRAKKQLLPHYCKHLFFKGRYECVRTELYD